MTDAKSPAATVAWRREFRLLAYDGRCVSGKFVPDVSAECTCRGYKITGLMLENFFFKQLHNRNVVTLNVLPSPIPAPLHANLPLLEAMLQAVLIIFINCSWVVTRWQ